MKSIIRYIENHLSEKRLRHTYNVKNEAKRLAKIYGVEEEKAELAALCHDMYKCISAAELNSYVSELKLDEKYRKNLNLAHSKIAAQKLKLFGINDKDVINAVSYHTTGRAEMSILEKIIYISDAIEIERDYPGVDELRKIVDFDIDKACLMSFEKTVEYLENIGSYIDEDTLQARDYLKNKERKLMIEKEFTKDIALQAAQVLSDKKAEDIVIIDIGSKVSFADYMVIATGNSERQIGTLADDVDDKLAQGGIFAKSIEGQKTSGWLLLDFGDVIVNVLTREMRERYNIEKIWGDCDLINFEEEI